MDHAGYRPDVTTPHPALDIRLLVVPGLGLDARSWDPVLQRLPAPVEVRLLPGYGLPAPRGTDVSPSGLGSRLGAELLGGPPTVLVGHSAGCQVVAHAARTAGTAVVGLVLVGPTTDPRATGWLRLGARWLRTAVHEDPRQLPGLVRQYRRTGLGAMGRAMDAARHDDLSRTMGEVRLPVLAVRGALDRICPQDWCDALTERCVTLPSRAHMVPSTCGAGVADAVLRFLARVTA
jgi:pimeloyl-ACP methyl ester carboxylesterase